MEQQIKIAAKLYKCRDAMKGLFGNEFFEKIAHYIALIQIEMQKTKVDDMKACLQIAQSNDFKDNPTKQVVLFAAVVEMIEPSEKIIKP